jgi:hypothetical protein
MYPIIGVSPNQVSIDDDNVSDYTKFEAAKAELVFVLFMLRELEGIHNDSNEYREFKQRKIDLEAYLESEQKKGCYIATMAYGDYDHPQVMILRQFRDEVLDNSDVGKWFIKTYYYYSPKLVEKLKSKRRINTIIRKTLNQFIKLIK